MERRLSCVKLTCGRRALFLTLIQWNNIRHQSPTRRMGEGWEFGKWKDGEREREFHWERTSILSISLFFFLFSWWILSMHIVLIPINCARSSLSSWKIACSNDQKLLVGRLSTRYTQRVDHLKHWKEKGQSDKQDREKEREREKLRPINDHHQQELSTEIPLLIAHWLTS